MIIVEPAAVRPSIASHAFALYCPSAEAFGILAAGSDILLLRGRTRLELPGTFQVTGNTILLAGEIWTHVENT